MKNYKSERIELYPQGMSRQLDQQGLYGIMGVMGTFFKGYFKGIIREAVEEVIDEKRITQVRNEEMLSSDDLCKRWRITPNTLRARENDGIIAPAPVKGRKKLYKMGDVLNAEASGCIKNVI